MIALVTEKNAEDFISACGFDEMIGARMVTLLACYGFNSAFCLFWLQTDDSSDNRFFAAISRFERRLTISASRSADLRELSEFAAAIGGYRYIEAAPFVCKSLDIQGSYNEFHMMRYTSGSLFAEDYSAIDESPPLNEFYTVISTANPWLDADTDWSGWYTHTSHLIRHGLGFAALIRDSGSGSPAATGGVFTSSGKLAVISCIATLPQYRGKGYAALTTKYLADKIILQGKTPALFCASDKLADYYATLGFSRDGKCGSLSRT